ncbi:hypothetical protein E2C01_076445 [Portunus trituberculatus]|uniref:Uncharacterized protein n=1 Tax=Portunus trituberculatus TaxID=210409 RepID=A0A5B7IBK4_PORTR|nr:hypothetical protein [Portunus trituberculatus]
MKEDVLDRESDITCGILWWEDVGDVEEHVGGEGAAHPEACEDHLLPPCGAIGGGPLAQDGFDGVEVKVVTVTLCHRSFADELFSN